jgi:hypothetical protein
LKSGPDRCIGRSMIQWRQESIGGFDREVRYRDVPHDTDSQIGEFGPSQATGPGRWFSSNHGNDDELAVSAGS